MALFDGIPKLAICRGSDFQEESELVYSNMPDLIDPDYFSIGFEQGMVREIGDRIILGGSQRRLLTVEVILSSAASASDFGGAANYTYPMTLRIYDGRRYSYTGQLLATVVQTNLVPYKPEGWVSNGIAFRVVFDCTFLNLALPDVIIYTLDVNSTHGGNQPKGGDGGKDYDFIGFCFAADGVNCGGVKVGGNDPSSIFMLKAKSFCEGDPPWISPSLVRVGDGILPLGATTPIAQIYTGRPIAPSSIQLTGATNLVQGNLPDPLFIASVTGSTAPVTITYAGQAGTSYQPTSIPPTRPGRYTATASVASDAVYLGTESSIWSFVIAPSPLAGTNTTSISMDAVQEVPLAPSTLWILLGTIVTGLGSRFFPDNLVKASERDGQPND